MYEKKQIKKIIIAQHHPSLIPINILSFHEIYLFIHIVNINNDSFCVGYTSLLSIIIIKQEKYGEK